MLEGSVAVRVLRLYVIEVTLEDGRHREIDIEPFMWGEVFAPLRDPALFAQAAVDPTFGSVSWPTGADLAPEFLFYGEDGPPRESYGDVSPAEGHVPAAAEPRWLGRNPGPSPVAGRSGRAVA